MSDASAAYAGISALPLLVALSLLVLHGCFYKLTETLILLSFFYIGHLVKVGFFFHLQIILIALLGQITGFK